MVSAGFTLPLFFLHLNSYPYGSFAKRLARWLAAAALLLIPLPSAYAGTPQAVPGQYLIKFRKAGVSLSVSSQDKVHATLGVRLLRQHQLTGAQFVESMPGVKFNDEYAKRLLASGTVEYIEPNYIVSINRTPNDSRFSEQWGMHNTGQTGGSPDVDIDAPEAWELTTSSSSVVVGIVDTGISYNHPDLAANVWRNPNEIPGNGADDDGNGVVDDVYGYDAISDGGDPVDQNGHGTHCAGSIGAVGNNGQGISGLNWNVKLMGLRFLDGSGSGTTENAVRAIEYAVRMKNAGVNLRVLSNSWGGSDFSQALQDTIASANAAGMLFVVAAGNSSSDNDVSPVYPASYAVPNVLTVAALDSSGNMASFSNYGASSVHIAAPGVDVLSTYLNGQYTTLSGTSMATPVVAAVAAMVLGRESNLSVAELRDRLLSTSKPLGSLNGLIQYPGIVDAMNALTNSRTTAPPSAPSITYTKSSGSLNWDADLGTRIITADDGYVEMPVSFGFPFYGGMFTRIAISANGRVIPLGGSASLPSAPDYSNKISPGISIYNDDLTPSQFSPAEGGVWYKSDSGKATITWVSVSYAHRGSSYSAAEIRFQAKLFADGRIEFDYLDTYSADSSFSYGASATIGLAPVAGVAGQKLLVSHNTADESEVGDGRALLFTSGGRPVKDDFDGDGTSDIVVWRPPLGYWFLLLSGTGFDFSRHQIYQLGLPGDVPLTGDFDGDRRSDLVVWRPANGTWYFRLSSTGFGQITSIQWGLPGDKPLTGDYDGDGRSDLVVYRESAGLFLTLFSASGFNRTAALAGSPGAMSMIELGGLRNDALPGDFTGDGRDDYSVVWELVRFWSVKDQSNHLVYSLPWGLPTDKPLACDTDGDNIADRIVLRENAVSGLDWYGALSRGGASVTNFGAAGDLPGCTSDYDGDGRADRRVFHPATGEWHIQHSSDGSERIHQFGLPGDIPL